MNTFTSVHHIPGDGYWLSVLNAASIFGRVIPGVLADRYGKMTTLLPHLCIATLLLFLFPLFDNVSGRVALRCPDCSLTLLDQLSMIAFALVFGYCCGCYVSLVPSCVNQLGPASTAGSRMGALFSVMSIAGVSSAAICCAVQRHTHSPTHSSLARQSLASFLAALPTAGGHAWPTLVLALPSASPSSFLPATTPPAISHHAPSMLTCSPVHQLIHHAVHLRGLSRLI